MQIFFQIYKEVNKREDLKSPINLCVCVRIHSRNNVIRHLSRYWQEHKKRLIRYDFICFLFVFAIQQTAADWLKIQNPLWNQPIHDHTLQTQDPCFVFPFSFWDVTDSLPGSPVHPSSGEKNLELGRSPKVSQINIGVWPHVNCEVSS